MPAVGLDHRADEGAHVVHVAPLGETSQGLGASLAELHLAQHPHELVRERPLGLDRHLLYGGVEPEPCLHADRHQVDRIGQLAPEPLVAVVGALVEVEIRGEEADHQPGQREQHSDGERRTEQHCDEDADDQAGHRTDHLAGDDPVHRPARRVPGRIEPASEPLGRVRPGQPAADAQRAGAQRLDHPVGERQVDLVGELLGGLSHRLEDGQRPVDASRLLVGAQSEGQQHDRSGDEQDPEGQDDDHLRPPPSRAGSSRRLRC